MTERTLPKNARLIPPEAARVFNGVIFDVYQWQQQMFDGTYQTFEMIKRPDSVFILAVDDDGIITSHEEQPGGIVRKSHLPVGRVDPTDESVLAAAKRELLEETGLSFADWSLFEVNQPERKIEWFVHFFIARHKLGQVAVKQDAGEKILVDRSSYDVVRKKHMKYSQVLQDAETLEELLNMIEP